MLAQVTLTPAEGKRLIGKAVATMDIVQEAIDHGTVIVATSTTTAYVFEELRGQEIEDKGMFTAGVVTKDGCSITDPQNRYDHHVIKEGKIATMKSHELRSVLADMGPGDIFIKGANAIDPFGSAGILLGGSGGGTIGTAWGYLAANGVTTIITAGLEKLVPVSLTDVVPRYGKGRLDLSLGWPCGMMVVQGTIVTELEAFKELFGVEAIPIGGGGIDGGEGCKIFIISGDEEGVNAAFDMTRKIKGEPKLTTKTIKRP
jgi:hypothetical protein